MSKYIKIAALLLTGKGQQEVLQVHASTLQDSHGVALYFCESANELISLANRGVDLLLVNQQCLEESILGCNCPTAILERNDSAALTSTTRRWIDDDRVVMVIKGTTLSPASLHHEVDGRYHVSLLTGMQRTPVLPVRRLDKIRLGFSFATSSSVRSYADLPGVFSGSRPFAIHFAGIVKYATKDGPILTAHRQAAFDAISKLELPAILSEGHAFTSKNYLESLLQSKAVVSPWGYGESCYRDFEAILAGCVLIKPNSSHVDSWPDIYRPTSRDALSYIRCANDFSNLVDITREVIGNYSAFDAMRQFARARVIEAMGIPQVSARLAKLFREALTLGQAAGLK